MIDLEIIKLELKLLFIFIDLKTLEPIRKECDKGDKEAKKFMERIKSQM